MTAPKPLELWLVRHARPLAPEGLCYGRLDLPADAAHTQARAEALTRAWQASPADDGPAMAWHSPSARAQALARAAAACGLPHATADARLQEMDFGHWEGQPWNGIPRNALDAWAQDFFHHCPGQGESVARLLTRVADALRDGLSQAHACGARRVLWFTHAGVIRAVEVCLRQPGLQPPTSMAARDWPSTVCDFGHWIVHRME